MSNQFDANHVSVKLATVIERLDELKTSHKEARSESRADFEKVHSRISAQQEEIQSLKAEDIVRARQTKWAVATASLAGWLIALWAGHTSK